jgi:hypothetical protein
MLVMFKEISTFTRFGEIISMSTWKQNSNFNHLYTF